jgi:branched-chain amino acid transport system substrate-binding protein
MNAYRTLFSIMISALIIFMLAACSGGASTTSSSSTKANKEKTSTKLAQGVTDDEILIGHLGPQTGPIAVYDLVRKGIESYFNYINENGGVNGRKLKLVAYDDQYQPAKSVQLAKRLVEDDKVFAMVGNVGTAPNLAIKDYVVETGIPMVMTGTGNNVLTKSPIPNYMGSDVINNSIEVQILLDYAIEELGGKKLAISYQNDDYGKESLATIKEALKKYPGVEIVEEVSFVATDTEFSSQAQKIDQANPDTIMHFSSPGPAANLKKALYKIGFNKANFVVNSVAGDSSLFELAGKDVWEGTYSGATIPLPDFAKDDEQMKIFVERYSKDYPNDNLEGSPMLGWAAASVLVEAIKRTGEDLTWENFLKTFYTFDNWQGSIYTSVSFGEGNHYGLNSMTVTQAKNGKIIPVSKTISFDPASGDIQYTK